MQQYTNVTGAGAKKDGAGTSAVTVQAKEIARAGTEQAKQIGETAKARALREVESKREKIAGEIEKLAGVLEKETQGEVPSQIVDLAAKATRSLATTLQDRSAEQILQDLRRSPVAMLAGSFALGFVAFRLLKS